MEEKTQTTRLKVGVTHTETHTGDMFSTQYKNKIIAVHTMREIF